MTYRRGLFAAIVACAHFVFAAHASLAQSASPNDMACMPLGSVETTDTPPRLARAVRDCIAQTRFDDAMQVFMAYSVFGTFDQQRVRDESGHMAFVELNSWIFGGYPSDVISELRTVLARLRDRGDFFAETCAGLRNIGWPIYRPEYMIRRGILPLKDNDDWKNPDFSAALAWETALVEVNGCPAQ